MYKVKAKLISMPESHKKPLLPTLDMYDSGKDISNSPLIQSGINRLHEGCAVGTESLANRQDKFISLYEDIKQSGCKVPLWVFFDDSGRMRLYDGFHRLAILLHLGIEEVEVTTDWRGIDGQVGKDFPLVDILRNEPPVNGLYQPVDRPEFKDWYIDRPDSPKRLEFILDNLVGSTVLDIGCSEGYFSRELAKRGMKVTAIDWSKGLIASARYLSILEGLDIKYHCGDWYDIVQELPSFDNVLMLSVTHNDSKRLGVGRALQLLWALNRKSHRLFFEVPNMDNERQWNKPGYPNWNFHELNNIKKLEVILGMSMVRDYLGTRSIFLFDSKPSNIVQVDLKEGFSLLSPKSEEYITPLLLKYREWEPEVTTFVKGNLKPGQTFVDVGANIGYYTVLSSKLGAKVYSFEPASDVYQLLLDNIKLNNCSNIHPVKVALSDTKGTASLCGGVSTGERSLVGGESVETVDTTTLDSLMIKPDMIKIDTEGFDSKVIAGGKHTIGDNTIVITENTVPSGFTVVGKTSKWLPVNKFIKRASIKYHLLGLAHTKTNKDYVCCAITQNVYKVAQMLMGLGYEVYHYGVEGSSPPCTESIEVVSAARQQEFYGDSWKTGFFIYKKDDAVYQEFNANAIKEITKRAGPQDILLVFNGNAQKPIADATKLTTVEASVGYEGVFTNKRVFESYSWMHYIYGMTKTGDGNFYDAVIPLAIDPDDFIYKEKKDSYFLYMGRIIPRKGVHIAQQVVDRIGAKLVVVGQGNPHGVVARSPNVEYRSPVGVRERAELLANARAVFVPTLYLEPFGAVVAEAGISGTPVITTDWGAFPENIIDGETGFRCHTFDDFLFAATHAGTISPKSCYEHAKYKYSLDVVRYQYRDYLTRVNDLFGDGWYTERRWKDENL